MTRFTVQPDPCMIGFIEGVSIDPTVTAYIPRSGLEKIADSILGIEYKSSLRVSFGWSFETVRDLKTVVEDSLAVVAPKYDPRAGNLVSDLRCDWVGFVPFNTFDRASYEKLSKHGLALFANEVAGFQHEMIHNISMHPIYRKHAILRDSDYRFSYFKNIRKDPDRLSDAFHYYTSCIYDTIMISGGISRDMIEDDIGCHFMHYPELFFELLNFSILQGKIHE